MKLNEVFEIRKEITPMQLYNLFVFAERFNKDNTINDKKDLIIGITNGVSKEYNPKDKYLYIELWMLTDEYFEQLNELLEELGVDYAYGRDAYWFLIQKY